MSTRVHTRSMVAAQRHSAAAICAGSKSGVVSIVQQGLKRQELPLRHSHIKWAAFKLGLLT